MIIAVGCDHGGFYLKNELLPRLKKQYEVLDLGCFSMEPVDYPDIADIVSASVVSRESDCGILICGTGIGMSIAANKVSGIRAALCSDTYSAKMAKEHNDANIIAIGARTIGTEYAWEIINAYLNAHFLGGIHAVRVNKINLKSCERKA